MITQVSISGDGRLVVFTSTSNNLVPADANGTVGDIFIAGTGFASGQ